MVLADIHEEAVRAAVKDLVAAGHKALAIHCDVTRAGSCRVGTAHHFLNFQGIIWCAVRTLRCWATRK